jgi:hypothetical protein
MALLETLAAMTILASAGIALSLLASQALHAVAIARLRADEIRRANAFLHAVTLWPREDLERRLGERAQGDWKLEINRSLPLLYTVVLRDSTGTRDILRTALFRPAIDVAP